MASSGEKPPLPPERTNDEVMQEFFVGSALKRYVGALTGVDLVPYARRFMEAVSSVDAYQEEEMIEDPEFVHPDVAGVTSQGALHQPKVQMAGLVASISYVLKTVQFYREPRVLIIDPSHGGTANLVCGNALGPVHIVYAANNTEDLKLYTKRCLTEIKRGHRYMKTMKALSYERALEHVYDLIIIPHSVHKRQECLDSYYYNNLTSLGCIVGMYAHALAAHTLEGALGFEYHGPHVKDGSDPTGYVKAPLTTTEGVYAKVTIAGKTYYDPKFVAGEFHPRNSLVMDSSLKEFVNRKPFCHYVTHAMTQRVEEEISKYFRVFICLKSSSNPLEPPARLNLAQYPVSNNPQNSVSSHVDGLDMAIALRADEAVRFVSLSNWYYYEKLNGTPASLIVHHDRSELYCNGVYYRIPLRGAVGWVYHYQYEVVDCVAIFRHLNQVKRGGHDLPVGFENRQHMLKPELFHSVAKLLREFPKEDLKEWEGVVFAQGDSTRVSYRRTSPEDPSSFETVGSMRWIKPRPTVDISTPSGVVEVDLKTGDKVRDRHDRNYGNGIVRRSAIANMASHNLMYSLSGGNTLIMDKEELEDGPTMRDYDKWVLDNQDLFQEIPLTTWPRDAATSDDLTMERQEFFFGSNFSLEEPTNLEEFEIEIAESMP